MRRFIKMIIHTAGHALPGNIRHTYFDNRWIALPVRSARAFVKRCPFSVDIEGETDLDKEEIDENYSYYDSLSQLTDIEPDLLGLSESTDPLDPARFNAASI